MSTPELFLFFLFGYVATVALETPVLMLGLSEQHSTQARLMFGFLLTAFTYPVVVLLMAATILPAWGQVAYLVIAETYAPVAEVLFFRFVLNKKLFAAPARDAIVIVLANIFSFVVGAAFLSDWISQLIRYLLR